MSGFGTAPAPAAPQTAEPVAAAPVQADNAQAAQNAPQPPVAASPAPAQPAPAAQTGFGGQEVAKPNTGFGGTDATQAAPPAVVDPASYTQFTLPQGVDVNNEAVTQMMEQFKSAAGKRGMTQAQAQASLDLMTELNVHAEAADVKQHEEKVAGWVAQSQQLGLLSQESTMKANQALVSVDPKGELRQVLNDTGLVNHPAMIQVFAAFAAAGVRPAALTNMGGQVQPAGTVDLKTALYGPGGRR